MFAGAWQVGAWGISSSVYYASVPEGTSAAALLATFSSPLTRYRDGSGAGQLDGPRERYDEGLTAPSFDLDLRIKCQNNDA